VEAVEADSIDEDSVDEDEGSVDDMVSDGVGGAGGTAIKGESRG
jgi:hypothetical protein